MAASFWVQERYGVAGWASALALVAAALPSAAWAQAAPTASPVAAPSVPQAEAALSVADLRWLNRVSGGARASDADSLLRLGRTAWLDEQLKPPVQAGAVAAAEPTAADVAQPDPKTPLTDWLQRRQDARAATRAAPPGDNPASEQATALQKAYRDEGRNRLLEARTSLFHEAVLSPWVLREQMLWFWLNHFSVYANKNELGAMVGDYARTLRPLALGSFRDLLRASLMHPAMLVYLDNDNNRAGKINENYARELMELHTLGVNKGYTQADVQELARVLTGLVLAPGGRGPQLTGKAALKQGEVFVAGALAYNPTRHDSGDKTLLGTTIQGEGWPEIEQVISLLANSPATAEHLSRQLYQYFVADDAARAPQALIHRMSATYLKTQGDIASVLRVLLSAPELDAALGQRLRSPWQYSVALMRSLAETLPESRRDAFVDDAWRVPGELNQAVFDWRTPDGYPMDSREWLNPAQMARRVRVAQRLAYRAATIVTAQAKAAASAPAALPPDQRVPGPPAAGALAPLLSASTRATLAAQNKPAQAQALFLVSPEFMLH